VQEELTGGASEDARIADARQVSHWGTRAWFNVHFGPRISIENTVGYGLSTVSYTVEGDQGQSLGLITGALDTREVTGGINYRLTPPQRKYVRLYARAGYGWTSYRLTRVTVGDAAPDAELRVRGGRLPTIYPSASWWPNTSYGGLGLEVFTPPRDWLFNRLGVGARVEVGGSLHRLNVGGSCNCRVTAERGDIAFMLLFGW
jgi:hypothetical protein